MKYEWITVRKLLREAELVSEWTGLPGGEVLSTLSGPTDWILYKNMHFTLRFLQECFPHEVYAAYIIKPEKFWEKQKTSLGSAKYKFEVGSTCEVIVSTYMRVAISDRTDFPFISSNCCS